MQENLTNAIIPEQMKVVWYLLSSAIILKHVSMYEPVTQLPQNKVYSHKAIQMVEAHLQLVWSWSKLLRHATDELDHWSQIKTNQKMLHLQLLHLLHLNATYLLHISQRTLCTLCTVKKSMHLNERQICKSRRTRKSMSGNDT